ncbi:PAS domain S-box protein [Mongoliitalea daihaiensis]|nr:PAS domain S-box protein [Mongoliitalea daihaiensis]
MLGIHQDVTLIKEEQLKLETVLQDTGVGFWDLEIATGKTSWSELVYKIHEVPLSFDHNKVKGIEFYHPDYQQKVIDSLNECIQHGKSFSFECILNSAKGNQKWVRSSGRRVGEKILGSFQDITESKKKELLFKGIFNSTISFIGFLDTNGILLEVNDTAVNLAGVKHSDVIGKYFWDCYWWQISIQAQEELKANFQKALAGEAVEYEVAVWIANHTPITILFTLKPIFDDKGKVIYIIPEGRPVQELVDARRRYKSVLEGTNVGTWEWNVQTGETVFDENSAGIIGYSLEELAPTSIHTWQTLVHPEDLVESGRRLNDCFERKTYFYELETRMKHKDGHWVWVYDRGKVLEWTDDGKPLMMYGTHQDISKRKNAEEIKNRVLDRFELISEHIPGVIYQYQLNPDGTSFFPYASSGLKRIYGISPSQVEKEASLVFESIFQEDLEQVKTSIQNSAENLTQWQGSYRTVLPSGEVKWVEGNATPRKNPDGSIIWHGYIRDITERKQKEEALRISEEAFRGNFENAAVGMAIISPQGQWQKVNRKICEIVGYTEEELMQLTFQDITHPDDLHIDLGLLNELVEGKRDHYQMEKRYFHKDGHIVYIILAVSMVKNENDEVLYFISQIIDISPLKQAEFKLKNLLAENQALIEATTEVALISTDIAGEITNVNSGTEKLLGFTNQTAKAQHIKDIIFIAKEWQEVSKKLLQDDSENIETSEFLYALANDSRYQSREFTLKKRNGATIEVLLSVTEIKLEDKTTGYLIAATDISHIKSIQQQLEQKNEELEQFAYIAAHDLKEPLRGITTYLSILQKKYSKLLDEKAIAYIEHAYTSANRMKSLITDILDFSKTGVIDEEPIDLNKLVDSVINNYTHDQESRKINFIKSDLPMIKGDLSSFIQLFTNFIENGIKYQPKEQIPEITIAYEEDEKEWLFMISDNGIGIASEHQDKVFEIFKRLHINSEYSGTGIGLASCKKIVTAYGGKIWYEPNSPQGTIFKFTLPKKYSASAK